MIPNGEYYWCFTCKKHYKTDAKTCPECGRIFSYNSFTKKQVDDWIRLDKIFKKLVME